MKPKPKPKDGDIRLDSTRRLARYDSAKIKRLKIKSPNTKKMHCARYGNTEYFFHTKRKMETFIRRGTHYHLLKIFIHPEDREEPVITLIER
jgi:hypothetical protein